MSHARHAELDLPPTPRSRLSAWGWLGVAGSFLVFAALARSIPTLGMLYCLFVLAGLIVGLPGGMHYRGDVDDYLARTPTAGVKREISPCFAVEWSCESARLLFHDDARSEDRASSR